MTGKEISDQVREKRAPETCVIKWWRNDKDMVDFETVDRFLERVRPEEVYDGFVLLDMEKMWTVLTDLDPDKLTRIKKDNREMIEWIWSDKNGEEKVRLYPFTPESVISFINDEFFA